MIDFSHFCSIFVRITGTKGYKTMKRIFIFCLLLLVCFAVYPAELKVAVVDSWEADMKVYAVSSPWEADLKVCIVSRWEAS